MNYINKIKRNIKEKIIERKEKTDKNGSEYLILELDNDENVFVFPIKVGKERWDDLNEGNVVDFVVEEGKEPGNNILVDFTFEK